MAKQYQIRYDGDFSDLEAKTLLTSLLSMVESLQEISRVHNEQLNHDYKLDVKIIPFQKGSFIVSFSLHAKELIESIFRLLSSSDSVAYISGLIASLTGIIQLIKWMRGEKPAKIEINNNNGNIVIINNQGKTKEISSVDYKILQSVKIHEHVTSCFSMIRDNESIDSFTIIEQDGNNLKELVNVERSDFDVLSTSSNILDSLTNINEEIMPNACVTIVKLSFEKNYKWSFYYNGFKLNASIKDELFYKEIDARIPFAKGDKLIVDLRIIQEYSKEARSFVNKEYVIDKVISHIPYRDDQTQLEI